MKKINLNKKIMGPTYDSISKFLLPIVAEFNVVCETLGVQKLKIEYDYDTDKELEVMEKLAYSAKYVPGLMKNILGRQSQEQDELKNEQSEFDRKICLLEEEKLELQSRCSELENEIESYKNNTETREQLENLQQENDTLKEQLNEEKLDKKDYIKAYMNLRNDILRFKQSIKENENPDAVQMLTVLYDDMGEVLEGHGFETIDEDGKINSRIQEVITAQKTKDESLKNTVAKTVAPGYRFNGEIYTKQQVIVYTF